MEILLTERKVDDDNFIIFIICFLAVMAGYFMFRFLCGSRNVNLIITTLLLWILFIKEVSTLLKCL